MPSAHRLCPTLWQEKSAVSPFHLCGLLHPSWVGHPDQQWGTVAVPTDPSVAWLVMREVILELVSPHGSRKVILWVEWHLVGLCSFRTPLYCPARSYFLACCRKRRRPTSKWRSRVLRLLPSSIMPTARACFVAWETKLSFGSQTVWRCSSSARKGC